MAFNIKTRAIPTDTFLHLRDPETDVLLYEDEARTKPVGIELWGKSSEAYKNIQAETARKIAMRKGKPTSLDEDMANNVKFMVALSKGGVNIDYDGQAVNSPEVFKAMYEDDGLYWIRDQVWETLSDAAAFLK